MSLAATTTTAITIIDRTSLTQDATAYDAQKIPVLATPTAHAWSPDNITLYIVSSYAIHSFSPAIPAPTMLYNLKLSQNLPLQPLQPVLVVKDKSTLIFAQGSAIYLLAIGSTSPRISSSLIGHSALVTSLSLSNDASLLASSSASGTVCVHNLAHNSLTVLKGLPTRPGTFSKHFTCAFHPHIRTRLLVGCGDTLVVYDTTRPSSPIKTIVISEMDGAGIAPNIGHIVAISCSPYTRTLIVVAFNSGFLALVDLGKDRPYFKNLRLKVPVTSMTFTADGGSLALGTENGKVIVIELRDMEHGFRELPVGDEGKGERVIALSIQRRIRVSPSTSSVPSTKLTTMKEKHPTPPAPLVQYDLNNPGIIARSPVRRIVSSSLNTNIRGVKVPLPLKSRCAEQQPKRVFSPVTVAASSDGDGELSVQVGVLMGGGKVPGEAIMDTARTTGREGCNGSKFLIGSQTVSPSTSTSSKTRRTSMLTAHEHDRPSSKSSIVSRPRTLRTSPAGETVVIQSSGSSNKIAGPSQEPGTHTKTRPENTSQGIPLQIDVSDDLEDTGSHLPSGNGAQGLVYSDQIYCDSAVSATQPVRTPTPDLSFEVEALPMWKDGSEKRDAAIDVAKSLTGPDMERWHEAGHGNQAFLKRVEIAGVKHVGWAGSDENFDHLEPGGNIADSEGDPPIGSAMNYKGQTTITDTKSMPSLCEAKSVSPMRRPPVSLDTLQLSPVRSPPLRGSAGISIGTRNGGAQELLRSVVNDVMFEYRQETREDIKGLHLDLLRLGRSWKNELRSLMDEYVGGLRELREENARLKKENERLRRSF